MYKRITAALVLSTALTGCAQLLGDNGLFRDRAHDYKQSHLKAPLVVPKGVSVVKKEDVYKIPAVKSKTVDVEETPPTL